MGSDAAEDLSRRQRVVARVVAAGVALAVAWPALAPIVGQPSSDGFPLSTYPMFSRDRGQVVEVPTVVALGDDGEVERLPPSVIADTDQVLVAAAAVRRAVDGGPAAAGALCAEVAERAGGRGTSVAVVVERHDAIAWSAGDREPLDRREVSECPIGPSS
jgi:hypothetical protein